jgi:hypothetical protein
LAVYVSYARPRKRAARFAMRDDRTVFLFVFATDRPLHLDPLDIESHKVGCQFGAIASLQPAKATVNEDKALANASQASYKNAPLNFCSRRAKSLLPICRPIELMKELTHAIEWGCAHDKKRRRFSEETEYP